MLVLGGMGKCGDGHPKRKANKKVDKEEEMGINEGRY